MKPGYKQTELGILPVEWEVKPLRRISPSQSVGLVINPSTYFDKAGTVPLLVGSNISDNAIDSTTSNRITKKSNEMLPASCLAAGDLVTVRVGEPGVTAVVPPELDGCNCASMMIVRQHPSFDSHWLCYMMNSRYGRKQVEHVQYGTAQKQFNISDAVDFLYPFPLLSEQHVIANALNDVDWLLGGLDRIITKKRDIKQAAMQQLLTGQTRLPGFSGEWEIKSLDQIAVVTSGKRLPLGTSLTKHPTPHPYIRVTDMRIGTVSLDEIQFVPESVFPAIKHYRIYCEDIFISVAGSLGIVGKVPKELNGANLTENANRISKITCSQDYLLHVLMSPSIQKTIDAIQTVGAQPKLALTRIRKFSIWHPPLSEQIAIADVLSSMDSELAALEQRRDKTRLLKQSMMQELLTGRIRFV